MATPRNKQYRPPGGGGGGGGIGALLGALVGAPGLEGGEAIIPEGPPTAEGVMPKGGSTTPLSVGKPTWGQRIFNPRGVMDSQQMGNMLKMDQYNQLQAQDLLGQRGRQEMQLEQFRSANNISEQEKKMAAEEAAKDADFARKHGYQNPTFFRSSLMDPRVVDARHRGLISTFEKPTFDNAYTGAQTDEVYEGTIPYKQAQTDQIYNKMPSEEYLTLSEGQAGYNPRTGQVINNRKSYETKPEVMGGVVQTSLPFFTSGSFVRAPGGINREIESASRGQVPPMIARPPGQFDTNMSIGTHPLPQSSVTPKAPSLMNPTLDRGRLMEDLAPIINAVPLLQDWVRKKGMFSPRQGLEAYPGQ